MLKDRNRWIDLDISCNLEEWWRGMVHRLFWNSTGHSAQVGSENGNPHQL